MSSAKWWQFCRGLNMLLSRVLIYYIIEMFKSPRNEDNMFLTTLFAKYKETSSDNLVVQHHNMQWLWNSSPIPLITQLQNLYQNKILEKLCGVPFGKNKRWEEITKIKIITDASNFGRSPSANPQSDKTLRYLNFFLLQLLFYHWITFLDFVYP